MADHESVGCARKAPVGDEGNGVTQATTLDRRRDAEHFPHSGTADRSFAADHDHVAGLDQSVRNGIESSLFVIVDLGRTFEAKLAVSGELHDAPFRRDIAVADPESAALLDRCVGGDNDLLARRFPGVAEMIE